MTVAGHETPPTYIPISLSILSRRCHLFTGTETVRFTIRWTPSDPVKLSTRKVILPGCTCPEETGAVKRPEKLLFTRAGEKGTGGIRLQVAGKGSCQSSDLPPGMCRDSHVQGFRDLRGSAG